MKSTRSPPEGRPNERGSPQREGESKTPPPDRRFRRSHRGLPQSHRRRRPTERWLTAADHRPYQEPTTRTALPPRPPFPTRRPRSSDCDGCKGGLGCRHPCRPPRGGSHAATFAASRSVAAPPRYPRGNRRLARLWSICRLTLRANRGDTDRLLGVRRTQPINVLAGE